MLLNDNRSSYGMFSRAGRNAAEKFHLLVKKDEILRGIKKKPKQSRKNYDYTKQDENDDRVDIFKSDPDDGDLLKPKIKTVSNFYTTKQKNQDKLVKKLKNYKGLIQNKLPNPSCTKYNPKYQYVWKRTLTAPKWEKSKRKNIFSIKKDDTSDVHFYSTDLDFKFRGKNLVDMNKQSRRKSITGEEMKDNRSILKPKTANMRETSENSLDKINTRMNRTNSTEKTEVTKEKYRSSRSVTPPKKWVKIQAPDFKKIISRDQLEKIYGDKRTIIPFSFPNFKWTRPRPIVMVKYDRKVHKIKKEKVSEWRPSSETYDPHLVLDKINNFKPVKTPNFNLMTSRPNDDGPLPSYMKSIFSRQSNAMITEKALKMNNFSEGKFSSTHSSFWPKKTYNRIIELNILNSTKFKENAGLAGKKIDVEGGDEINDYIHKSMKFYNKNYDDLLKESMLAKFDNVTYKTIKRPNKFDNNEIEKFMINFEKV